MKPTPQNINGSRGSTASPVPGYWGKFAKTDAEREAALESLKQEEATGTPYSNAEYLEAKQRIANRNARNLAAARTSGTEDTKLKYNYSESEKLQLENLRKKRDADLLKPDAGSPEYKAWRQGEVAAGRLSSDPSAWLPAWEQHVNAHNNKVNEAYIAGINAVDEAHSTPMPKKVPNAKGGAKPSPVPNAKGGGKPSVKINTDGSISITRD
jgi:hypothetical protein